MELRPYQKELIYNIKKEIVAGTHSVCAVLGCGGGKSIIQGMIAKGASDKHNNVLFLVHRKELCQQIKETFSMCGVDFNYCNIEMVQGATKKIKKIKEPKIIITDECHHCLSASYQRIYESFPQAVKIGFTATPIRMKEGGLGNVFEKLIESVSVKWLIKNKYLSPYKYYSVKLADADGIKKSRGDFNNKELGELMEQNYIYGETIKTYKKLAYGKKTIVYCASIKSSKETADSFNNAGISAKHIDSKTPSKERKQIVDEFKNGNITVLCNVDLFGEGFDVPDCECVILLRPTLSLTLHIQQSMRSMRYIENKTAIIIDHVGNVFRHDLPDAERVWELATKQQKQKSSINVKQCPVCFNCMNSLSKICNQCGYEFPKQQISELEVIDADIVEVERQSVLYFKPYEYYKELKTFDEIREFQKAKKYKFGWVLRKCLELNIPIPPKYNYYVRNFI